VCDRVAYDGGSCGRVGTRSDAGGEGQGAPVSGIYKEECSGGYQRLSEAQWNFKPAPDRWSVAQVMEHIAAAEDFIRGMVKEKIMMAPAGEPGRDVKRRMRQCWRWFPTARTRCKRRSRCADKPFRITGSFHQTFFG